MELILISINMYRAFFLTLSPVMCSNHFSFQWEENQDPTIILGAAESRGAWDSAGVLAHGGQSI